jgi:hypothetical protein
MSTNYEPIGIDRFAKFDHSDAVNRIRNQKPLVRGWFDGFLDLLRAGDIEGARELDEVRKAAEIEARNQSYREGYGEGQHAAITITNEIMEAMRL